MSSDGNRDPLRVLIGDPDPIAREAIGCAFEEASDFQLIAGVGDAREATELSRHYRPDVVLLDFGGPGGFDGLAVCREIMERNRDARILILERSADASAELEAFSAGAGGVVAKSLGVGGIIGAARAISSGLMPHSDAAMRLLVERMRTIPEFGIGLRPIRSDLTSREWEVLDLLTLDCGTEEIALRMCLTTDTVLTHIKHLMHKLEVHDRAAAVEAGRRLRWPGPVANGHVEI